MSICKDCKAGTDDISIDLRIFKFRTFRLSVVGGVDYGSTSVGTLVSGPLFLSLGYYGVFGISALCNIAALSYIVGYLEESNMPESKREKGRTDDLAGGENTMTEQQNNRSNKNIVSRSILYALQGFITVVKQRDGLRRPFILLGLLSYTCYMCVYGGTQLATRIYFGRSYFMFTFLSTVTFPSVENKYGWDEDNVTTFLFCYKIGCWISLWTFPLLARSCRLTDNTIAIIASVTTAAGVVWRQWSVVSFCLQSRPIYPTVVS